MFQVEKINNGYVLHIGDLQEFYKNEKNLVTGIRLHLGLKSVGRPKRK